jgi:hypothetical protein
MNRNDFFYTDVRRCHADRRRCKINGVLYCDRSPTQSTPMLLARWAIVQSLIALKAHGVDGICRSIPYPGKSRISDFIREISVSICGQQYLSFKDVLP